VTIVEMLSRVAMDVGPTSRWVLVKRLRDAGIAMLTGTKFVGMEDGRAVVEGDGKRQTLEADTVVVAMGMTPEKRLYEQLKGKVAGLHAVGDCVDCKTIQEAIHSAWEVGCTL
jgi:pyruvate/2-oxoglutarate dehydrogenase complex dihydrolipoamide dehydrogenase (E3) component